MTREEGEVYDAREAIRMHHWNALPKREREGMPDSLVSEDSEDIIPKTEDKWGNGTSKWSWSIELPEPPLSGPFFGVN